MANYLLMRRRVLPDPTPVSPRMFYENAKRYDEWPGEDYSGSSARGAMKGWHKHGVCAEQDWPYSLKKKDKQGMTDERTSAARAARWGAYFRVNHKDLVAMHSAIAEVGVLFATASVHDGWNRVGADGIIPQSDGLIGGHAFAIVAYDAEGFWIQNSWGPDWGRQGLCASATTTGSTTARTSGSPGWAPRSRCAARRAPRRPMAPRRRSRSPMPMPICGPTSSASAMTAACARAASTAPRRRSWPRSSPTTCRG